MEFYVLFVIIYFKIEIDLYFLIWWFFYIYLGLNDFGICL